MEPVAPGRSQRAGVAVADLEACAELFDAAFEALRHGDPADGGGPPVLGEIQRLAFAGEAFLRLAWAAGALDAGRNALVAAELFDQRVVRGGVALGAEHAAGTAGVLRRLAFEPRGCDRSSNA
jgi:hypothetical protein